jgi:hypothetical protein
MHYFYADASFSLPPSRFRFGESSKKFFSAAFINDLVRLLEYLEPDEINALFINEEAIIDLSSHCQSFRAAARTLYAEAKSEKDCELIWLLFSKEIGPLKIAQSLKIQKFLEHRQTNFFLHCYARALPPGCQLEPELILRDLKKGCRAFLRWLNKIREYYIVQAWKKTPLRFKVRQEIIVPAELIGESGWRLPLPGDKIKNKAHLFPTRLIWLLKNCDFPKTKLTSSADNRTLYLPYYAGAVTRALRDNSISGFPVPLIKELVPKPKTKT